MEDGKELKIKIDRETHRKLREQLEQMKLVRVPGMDECETVEDLISFYIRQMFRMDSILLEGIMGVLKKYTGDNKFHQAFREIMEGSRSLDSPEASFGSIFDEEEDDEDFDDEFYYYDDDEFEESDKLERVDINSEEYKERQRKYEEEKKKNKK